MIAQGLGRTNRDRGQCLGFSIGVRISVMTARRLEHGSGLAPGDLVSGRVRKSLLAGVTRVSVQEVLKNRGRRVFLSGVAGCTEEPGSTKPSPWFFVAQTYFRTESLVCFVRRFGRCVRRLSRMFWCLVYKQLQASKLRFDRATNAQASWKQRRRSLEYGEGRCSVGIASSVGCGGLWPARTPLSATGVPR